LILGLFFYCIGKYAFLYNGGCKGEEPPADEGGCSAAELTPSGTIGFPSEKNASGDVFFMKPGVFFRLKHRRALGVTGIPVVYKL